MTQREQEMLLVLQQICSARGYTDLKNAQDKAREYIKEMK